MIIRHHSKFDENSKYRVDVIYAKYVYGEFDEEIVYMLSATSKDKLFNKMARLEERIEMRMAGKKRETSPYFIEHAENCYYYERMRDEIEKPSAEILAKLNQIPHLAAIINKKQPL